MCAKYVIKVIFIRINIKASIFIVYTFKKSTRKLTNSIFQSDNGGFIHSALLLSSFVVASQTHTGFS